MSFELEKLPNGDLKLKIVSDEEEEDRNWGHLTSQPQYGGLGTLMEESRYLGNGWSITDGDNLGLMTSAPMISDDLTVEDDGDMVVYGHLWYFPNYMVEDPVQTLRDRGEVIFTLASKPGELVPRKWLHKLDPKFAKNPSAQPHGMCAYSRTCREHAANKEVPSCKKRGKKGRRTP